MTKEIHGKIEVSFIIPLHNSQKFLPQCIESLMKSPMKEMEFIFIDDGSTDRSYEIIQKYQVMDERIIVHSQNKSGVSIARNTGISMATGKYLFFLDSDDYLNPDCWQVFSFILQSDFDVVAFSYFNLFEDGKSVREIIPLGISESWDVFDLKKLAVASSWLNTCWGKLIKRQLIYDKQIFFTEGLKTCEDSIFMLQCVQNAYTCYISDFAVLYYRHHPNSTMRKTDYDVKLTDIELLYQNRLNVVTKNNDKAVTILFYRNFFSVVTDLCLTASTEKSFHESRQQLLKVLYWQRTPEILENIDIKRLQPRFKRVEYKLIQRKLILVMLAYFRLKKMFK